MDSLLKNIRKIYPISEQSFEKLKNIFNVKKFKKKSALSHKNQISTKFYIVKSGIVRSYVTDDKGKEHIKFIYTNYSPVASFSSLIKTKENNVLIECLTDCDLIEVDFLEFKNLVTEFRFMSVLGVTSFWGSIGIILGLFWRKFDNNTR